MDLRLIVLAGGVIVGAVLAGAGVRLLVSPNGRRAASGAAANGPRTPRQMTASGILFLVIGAIVMLYCGRSFAVLARDLGPSSFPMSVLDLNAPSEPIKPGPNAVRP